MSYISKVIVTIGAKDLDSIIEEWNEDVDVNLKTVQTMNKSGEAVGFKNSNANRTGTCKVNEVPDDPTLPDWDTIITQGRELAVRVQPWGPSGPIGKAKLYPRVRFGKMSDQYQNGDSGRTLTFISIGKRRA